MKDLVILTGTTNPELRKKAEQVKQITKEIKQLVKDMELAMHEDDGIGLAAPQIGVQKRIILITLFGKDPEREEDNRVLAMINPEITKYSLETNKAEEGCLSVPGTFGKVQRYSTVEVEFLDLQGQKRKMKLHGLHAREVQHEIDHLDGVLFTDYLEKEKVVIEKKQTRMV